MLRAAPKTLFVFGDNMARAGNAARPMKCATSPCGRHSDQMAAVDARGRLLLRRDLPKVLDVVVPIWKS